MDAAVLEAECDDAAALAVLHQQVQREVLHKVVAVIPVRIIIRESDLDGEDKISASAYNLLFPKPK